MVQETFASRIFNDVLTLGIILAFVFFIISKYLEQKKGWSSKETWEKFKEMLKPDETEGFEYGRKIK